MIRLRNYYTGQEIFINHQMIHAIEPVMDDDDDNPGESKVAGSMVYAGTFNFCVRELPQQVRVMAMRAIRTDREGE